MLIIYKTLYGLKFSGKVFGQLLQECLLELGFVPSLAKAFIYMRKCPTADHYEYIATYVDDLFIIMNDPQAFLDQLQLTLKLKGSRPLNFHLGSG